MSRQSTSSPLSAIPTQRARRGRAAAPAVPLGSLTQRSHREDGGCAACGSEQVTRLALQLTDGTPVRFTSCHRCEHKQWEHAGSTLSVETVLQRTRKPA
jgi:hypothetical protein